LPEIYLNKFWLISTFYNYLRVKKFDNEAVLKIELQKIFDSKSLEYYVKGIHDLPRRRAEVMKTKGEYMLDK
jgi:hypothetical protein